jgi:Protein of unknown function (DUF2721)
MEFSLTTPAVLFPAISVLLLAYTSRFLAISTLIRDLKEKFTESGEAHIIGQIRNLRRRIFLIRNMQFLAVSSLLLCVISMYFIFENRPLTARYIFGVGMGALITSLLISLREIHLSVVALNLEMKDIEEHLKEKKNIFRKLEEFDL